MGIRQSASSLLLLSGGLDSTSLAALVRPKHALVLNYGQRPADAEAKAAQAVANEFGIELHRANLGIADFGSGILASGGDSLADAPSPEWWPFRNQFLATAASVCAMRLGLDRVILGSVRSDGARHYDGTADFYEKLDALVSAQEGGIRIDAPAVNLSTEELVLQAALSERTLSLTTSCHRSNLPCGTCPGCWKRQRVLSTLGVPGYTWEERQE